jgi:hypothetical protein
LSENVEPSAEVAGASQERFDPQQLLLGDEVARQVHQTVSKLPTHYAQALAWKGGASASSSGRRGNW